MDIDPVLLMLSLVPSGIGFVLFVYGKREQRWAHLAAGIVLMIYPYFVSTALQMIVGGAVVGGALWYALQVGW